MRKHSNINLRSSKQDDDVDDEVAIAAWTLVEMQQSKIDAETALNLQNRMQNPIKKRQEIPSPPPPPAKRSSRRDNHHHHHRQHHDTGNNNPLPVQQKTTNHIAASPSQVTTRAPARIPAVPPRPILPGNLYNDVVGECSTPLYKQLCNSDLNPHLSKVTLVKKQVKKYLLPLLQKSDGCVAEAGIQVVAYDWEGKRFPMIFKSWTEEKMFVLTGSGWKDLCTRHKDTLMVSDNLLILWMFRHRRTEQVSFIVNVVKMSAFGVENDFDQFIQSFVDEYHEGVRTAACFFKQHALAAAADADSDEE